MKKFLKKLWAIAVDFFTGSEEKAKKFATTVIKMTNAVKAVVDSPLCDVGAILLKKAIPGATDDVIIDTILTKADEILPKLIAQEAIVLGLLENSTVEEKANYVLSKIKFASDIDKDEFYHKFCVRAIVALSDGKLSYGEAVILGEMAYQQLKKNGQL